MLSTKQMNTVCYLLEEKSIQAAARRARISKVTLYAWLRDPEFKEKLKAGQDELFRAAVTRLKAATGTAVDKLIETMGSKDENQRRIAAKTILDFSFRVIEYQDLEERITRIEDLIEDRFIS